MGAVNTFRFTQLIQSEAIQYHIHRLGQIHRLFLQHCIRFAVPFITSCHSHHSQIIPADQL